MPGAGPLKYEIVNLALSHLGQKPLTSTTDAAFATENTVQAVAARRVYDACLRDTLADRDWGFATAPEFTLQDATFSTVNWDYAYTYPSNCVALWRVYNDATIKRDKGENFEVIYDFANSVQLILTNAEDAYARYTYYLIDTTRFSPKFVMAFSHKLAAALAIPLNGKEEQAKAEIIVYNGLISDAQRLSSYENNEAKSTENPFVDAR